MKLFYRLNVFIKKMCLFQSHKDYIRSTIFDTKANVNTAFLEKSVNLLAESIAHYVFNFSKSNDIMTGSYVSYILYFMYAYRLPK